MATNGVPRVRGTARVGPPTTGRSGGPAILVRQRRPDFLGPVYVLQLVMCWPSTA
jgi:hypothetical protein